MEMLVQQRNAPGTGVFAAVNWGSPMTIVGTPFDRGNVASRFGGNDGAGEGSVALTITGPPAVSKSITNGVFDQFGHSRSPTRAATRMLNAIFTLSLGLGAACSTAKAATNANAAIISFKSRST
jgi:hypothetical protein